MEVNFSKTDGLIAAIIQDSSTGKVLMLGYMNQDALDKTIQEKRVTFFSRSRKRLWTKGETSGNFLKVQDLLLDCDKDTLLIKAEPSGPVCHTGADTCFEEENRDSLGFLHALEALIQDRKERLPEGSYTAELFRKGKSRITKKLGEEAVELVIEGMRNKKKKFIEEAADLLYHYMVLLTEKGFELEDVVKKLKQRHG